LGDYLVVGIDTDKRVKELKGPERPINSLDDRATVLESIETIDEVVCFGSDEELREMVKKYAPRYLVVGSDYRDKEVIGSEWAEEVAFFSRVEGYSSTACIDGTKRRSHEEEKIS
jgi:D-beta-D-heptose 7-phosphate kinase/D-beta-D-heptose 1-phosphate adenosyltransferase